MLYLAVVLLLDVSEQSGVTEVALLAGAYILSAFFLDLDRHHHGFLDNIYFDFINSNLINYNEYPTKYKLLISIVKKTFWKNSFYSLHLKTTFAFFRLILLY